MKAKSKKKATAKYKPLTISVHGDGIDIDARIASAGPPRKSDEPGVFDQLFQQISAQFRAGDKTPGAASLQEVTDAIATFGSSLTDNQIEILNRTFTTEQAAVFDRIMKFAGLENQPGVNGPKEGDIDAVMRMINHAPLDILESFIAMAEQRRATAAASASTSPPAPAPAPAPSADQVS